MMLAILTFIRTPLGRNLVMGAAALAILAGLWFGLQAKGRHEQRVKDEPFITNPVTHKTWKSEALAAKRDFETCKANTTLQEATIQTQNAATDALHADSDRRARMLSDALQAARKTALVANARAEAILALQPAGGDACAKLVDLDRQLNGGR